MVYISVNVLNYLQNLISVGTTITSILLNIEEAKLFIYLFSMSWS